MTPRFAPRHIVALFALALGWGGIAACGDDPPPDHYDCSIGDPLEGTTCECNGNDCVCPSSGDCGILCIDSCDLQCAGSGSCHFICDDACDVACTGSGDCLAEVGVASSIACTGSGDCEARCDGDCAVNCTGSGACTVRCAVGAVCTLEGCSGGPIQDCGNGVQVCGGACPPG